MIFKYMPKASLYIGTILLYSSAITPVWATNVSSWGENPLYYTPSPGTFVAARDDEEIVFVNDITADGWLDPPHDSFPGSLSLNSSTDQTIDGNYHSFSGHAEYYNGRWYNYSLGVKQTGGSFTLKNLGKASNGDASNNTFSFTNLSGDTVYKKIEKSVNSFTSYFLSIDNPIVVNVKNSVFSENGQESDAKLLYMGSNHGTLNVTDSIFYKNTTGTGGPVIMGEKFDVNVENSIFYGNRDMDGNDVHGGAIYIPMYGGKLSIKNSYFINNEVNNIDFPDREGQGGAVYIASEAIHTIENSRFEGNISCEEGGAVYLYAPYRNPNVIIDYVKNSQFIGNKQTSTTDSGSFSVYGGGGGLSIGGGYIRTIDNVLFDSNSSVNKGGALYIEEPVKKPSQTKVVLVKDSTFKNNTAKLGGGMYFSSSYGINDRFAARIVDPEFTSNTATQGGGLYILNGNVALISENKDIVFSGNSATDTSVSNAGDDIYFKTTEYAASLFLNAAEDKKIVFNGTVATTKSSTKVPTININKTGVTYSTYVGDTETVHNAGTTGEIQFKKMVGDGDGNISNINLYGGTLSIGQGSTATNPDGLINYNNFTVAGDSTLKTANGVIGTFAPVTFNINAKMSYEFDLDLAAGKSDKLVDANVGSDGSVVLSTLNIITDTDAQDLKITYSDTNINGTLKDDYTITTSTATYDVTAGNDDTTGSYLLLTRGADVGGLPNAINNGSSVYSITEDADEVVDAWVSGNHSLSTDLAINGNGHAITTENGLDGIDVGSGYTLSMNNVTDMSGFNYAINNEGNVELTHTTISDDIINNGTIEVNEKVCLADVSGTGTMNINADHELKGNVAGNTINVKNAKLSGTHHLGSDTTLNVIGGTVDLKKNAVTVKSATFDANSTLCLAVDSLSDYGHLNAENITVANGAKLQATLAQGLVKSGETASIQLLSANNSDFNNFTDSFNNNMYLFEKADKNGKYNVCLISSAEDIVKNNGGAYWVSKAAKSYVDSAKFEDGSVGANIANQFAALAQNNAAELISEIKAIAPTEAAIVQDRTIADTSRLFRIVDNHLQGIVDPEGISAGDTLSGVTIWAKPYMGKTRISTRGHIPSQKSSDIGIITSIEKKITPEIEVGVGLHYDEMDIDTRKRDIDVETLAGFAYTKYKPSDWFINAMASYASSDYDEHKLALGSRWNACYNVNTASAAVMGGYEINYFTPEIGAQYYYITRNGYKDSASQYVHKSSVDYLRTVAGVHFARTYDKIRPEIYVGLSYDVVSHDNDIPVSLTNGTTYVVDGERLPRLGYELNMGLNTTLTDNITVAFNYFGSYRRKYRDHTGMLKFRYDF